MPPKRPVAETRDPVSKRAKEDIPTTSTKLDTPPQPTKNTEKDKICFSSFIHISSKALRHMNQKIASIAEKRNGKTVLPIDFIDHLANASTEHSRMEQSLDWISTQYKQMEIDLPNEEYKDKEREAKEEDYDQETRALITVYKLDRDTIRLLKCVTLKEIAKANPDQKIGVNVYTEEPEANWNMDYVNEEMTLKEYAKNPVGFARDIDLQECDNYETIEKTLKQVFQRLAPLSFADLCTGVAEGAGITTPFGYYKGKTLNYTRPHCESAGLLSLNVNLCGQPSEWFFCSPTHWQKILKMAEERGLDPRDAPFWPVQEELEREGVKVCRVEQEAGEVIVVNNGCVHWVKGRSSEHVSWNLLLPSYKALLGFGLCSGINQSIHRNNDVNEEALLWSLLKRNNVIPAIKKYKKETADLLFILALSSLTNFRAVAKMFEGSPDVTMDDLIKRDPMYLLKCDDCYQCLYFYSFNNNDSSNFYCFNCSKDKADVKPHYYRNWEDHVRILQRFVSANWPVVFGDAVEGPLTEREEKRKRHRETESNCTRSYPVKSFSGDTVYVPLGYEITKHLPNNRFEIRKTDEEPGEDSMRIINNIGQFIRRRPQED